MSLCVRWKDARQEKQPQKCRLYLADSQPQYEPTFDKWLNSDPEATPAARRGRARDMMMGDVTHLLPSGCPGWPSWPSCPTGSCWLLLRLNPTSLVSLSLIRRRRQEQRNKEQLVKQSWKCLLSSLVENVGINWFAGQANNVCKQISVTEAICQLEPRDTTSPTAETMVTSASETPAPRERFLTQRRSPSTTAFRQHGSL